MGSIPLKSFVRSLAPAEAPLASVVVPVEPVAPVAPLLPVAQPVAERASPKIIKMMTLWNVLILFFSLTVGPPFVNNFLSFVPERTGECTCLDPLKRLPFCSIIGGSLHVPSGGVNGYPPLQSPLRSSYLTTRRRYPLKRI